MNKKEQSKYIFLYRHGETDWNVLGLTMGQLEGIKTNFTEKGYQEILEISKSIEENKVEVIYCSDFNRTTETALIANKLHNLPIVITKQARGLNMGEYQGVKFSSFVSATDVKKCFENYDTKFPGGESINELNQRLLKFIEEICNTTKYSKIAIVTHSAAISNLNSFISKEDYTSLKMCCLEYNNHEFSVIDNTPVIAKKKIKKI